MKPKLNPMIKPTLNQGPTEAGPTSLNPNEEMKPTSISIQHQQPISIPENSQPQGRSPAQIFSIEAQEDSASNSKEISTTQAAIHEYNLELSDKDKKHHA
ncbi:hypothetical protein Droror1_Dr00012511 [Drosera rotundifolia]